MRGLLYLSSCLRYVLSRFRDLAGGIFPVEEVSSGEEQVLTVHQIKAATEDLNKFEEKLLKPKKRKQRKKSES